MQGPLESTRHRCRAKAFSEARTTLGRVAGRTVRIQAGRPIPFSQLALSVIPALTAIANALRVGDPLLARLG
jgi:hypothetical protein